MSPASEAGQERGRSHTSVLSACACPSQGLTLCGQRGSEQWQLQQSQVWCDGIWYYALYVWCRDILCCVMFYCMCAVGLCGVLWYWVHGGCILQHVFFYIMVNCLVVLCGTWIVLCGTWCCMFLCRVCCNACSCGGLYDMVVWCVVFCDTEWCCISCVCVVSCICVVWTMWYFIVLCCSVSYGMVL